MTPAQRKYDTDLVLSLRSMATWIAPRSRKVADTLKLAADRIDALSATVPVEQPPQLDRTDRSSPRQHRIRPRR